jgi:hypothetical protein
VLLHGGSPKGARADRRQVGSQRNVRQIAFMPDWTKHRKAAPFKRNDAMLAVMPIGRARFFGTPGITCRNQSKRLIQLSVSAFLSAPAGTRKSPSS